MKESLPKKINIFLTVDLQTINGYFNKHDPAPLYKRQLSHQFEEYIMTTVAAAEKNSVIFFKLKCTSDIDEQYADPLMYAIRRHFISKNSMSKSVFSRFKRQTCLLLLFSLMVIVVCHGIVPMVMNAASNAQAIIITSLDVLSWVILWRPIDKLIFDWNPHLREIALFEKLSKADMMIVEAKKETVKKMDPVLFAVSKAG